MLLFLDVDGARFLSICIVETERNAHCYQRKQHVIKDCVKTRSKIITVLRLEKIALLRHPLTLLHLRQSLLSRRLVVPRILESHKHPRSVPKYLS